MRLLSVGQTIALWVGIAAILFVLAFPPPIAGEEWPQFVYGNSTVCVVRSPSGECSLSQTTRPNWVGSGPYSYVHRVEMPVFAIVVVTAALILTLARRKN